ncbi:MAG: hypothetical protein AAF907_02295, partial [Planctomycetota bacterium]
AFLFPNYTFMLFFILPVKVKWLAAITWAFYVFGLLTGSSETRLMILAATLNFFLFFVRDIISRGKAVQRRKSFEKKQQVEAEALHSAAGPDAVASGPVTVRLAAAAPGSAAASRPHLVRATCKARNAGVVSRALAAR